MEKEIPKVIPASIADVVRTIASFLTRRSLIFLMFSVIIRDTVRGFAAAAVACLNISQDR